MAIVKGTDDKVLKISKQQSEKVLALQHQVDQAAGQLNNYIAAIIDGQNLTGVWDVVGFDPVKPTITIKKGATDGANPS